MRIAAIAFLLTFGCTLGCGPSTDSASDEAPAGSASAKSSANDDSSPDAGSNDLTVAEDSDLNDDLIPDADLRGSETSDDPDDDLIVDESADDIADDQTARDVDQERIKELQAELQTVMQSGNMESAKDILSQLHAADPANPQFTFMLAQLTSGLANQATDPIEAGNLLTEAGGLLREVDDSGVIPPAQKEKFMQQVHFVEARAHAARDKSDEAIKSVRELLESGFEQLDMIQDDKFLSALSDQPAFQELIGTYMREKARAEIAQTAPFHFDFSLQDLEGKTVTKADYQGKLLIVDIWGTWCPPCRKEIPHFVELRKNYADQLDIVGINYEQGAESEAVEKIRNFVDTEGVTYTCVVGDEPTKGQVPDFRGFPTTLFLDAQGNVRLKAVGYHPYEKLEAIILELLAENS